MNLYVAGPMRGIPHFNFPAFNEAAFKLRQQGHIVFNPAERDNDRHGTDISNVAGSEEQAEAEHGFSLREALGEDLAWICAQADGIVLLDGWEDSRGACTELMCANTLGLEVFLFLAGRPRAAIASPTGWGAIIKRKVLDGTS